MCYHHGSLRSRTWRNSSTVTPGTRLTSSSFPAVFFSRRCTSLSSVLSLSLLPFLHSSSSSISPTGPPSPSRPPLSPRLQLAARFATRCAPAGAVAAPLLLLSLDRGCAPRPELLPTAGLPFSFPSPTGSLSPCPHLVISEDPTALSFHGVVDGRVDGKEKEGEVEGRQRRPRASR